MTPNEKIMLARWVGIAVVFVFVGLAFAMVDPPKRRSPRVMKGDV